MTITIPIWISVPILFVRSLLRDREKERAIKRARADAAADVARLSDDALVDSLRPGRAQRGWDGRAHFATVPEWLRSRYSRTYYVASRDEALRLQRVRSGGG
jgi:hypothetical protein